MDIDHDVVRYSALGHATRLAMCRRIAAAGTRGITPGRLADAMDVPHNLVSHHLRLLVAAGLLHAEKAGREIVYRAMPAALVDAGGVLLELGAQAAR